MSIETKQPGASRFDAFEVALEIVVALRQLVCVVRRRDVKLAQQIVASASSVAANIEEARRRQGGDRTHLFRIAAGSAAETRAHLRVAIAWGWIHQAQADEAFNLLDRELAMLWRLTH